MLSLALSCASSRSEWLRQSENFLCKTNEGSTLHRKGDKMISEIPLLLVVTLVFGSISLIGSEGRNIYLEAKPYPATISLTSFRHQPGWKQFLFKTERGKPPKIIETTYSPAKFYDICH